MTETIKKKSNHTWLYIAVFISALAGLLASFELSVDAIIIAANPDVILDCDLSSTVSCGTVSRSWQAAILGFPNALLGLIFEPILLTVAVLGLMRTKFPKSFLYLLQIATLTSAVFAIWLFIQSAYVIGAFCPWCILITIGSTIIFFAMLRITITETYYDSGKEEPGTLMKLLNAKADWAIMLLIFIFLTATVIFKYGTQLFV